MMTRLPRPVQLRSGLQYICGLQRQRQGVIVSPWPSAIRSNSSNPQAQHITGRERIGICQSYSTKVAASASSRESSDASPAAAHKAVDEALKSEAARPPARAPLGDDLPSPTSLVTLKKLSAVLGAAYASSLRHATLKPKVVSWSYLFEVVVEVTRIIISEVVTAEDAKIMREGNPEQQQVVRKKIRMVQKLIDFPGGVPAVPGCRLERTTVGDLPAEWIYPKSWVPLEATSGSQLPPSDGVILFLHGGAYLVCGIATHRRLMSRLGQEAGLPVFAIDYRLMPEASFADILEDARAAFEHLLSLGYKPSQIAVAGDSAGGHLSLSLSYALLQEKGRAEVPGAVVAFSPWIDPMQEGTDTLTSWEEFQEVDYLGYALTGIGVAQNCFNGHPLGSFLREEVVSSLQGMPPLLIQAGGQECLSSEIAEFVKQADEKSGVKIPLQVWDDGVHVFQFFAEISGSAREALVAAGSFIRDTLSIDNQKGSSQP